MAYKLLASRIALILCLGAVVVTCVETDNGRCTLEIETSFTATGTYVHAGTVYTTTKSFNANRGHRCLDGNVCSHTYFKAEEVYNDDDTLMDTNPQEHSGGVVAKMCVPQISNVTWTSSVTGVNGGTQVATFIFPNVTNCLCRKIFRDHSL